MNNLREKVSKIEKYVGLYKKTDDKITRGIYHNKVESIISEAPQPERCNLYNYWARSIR